MAYVVSTTQTATQNAATYTVTLGAHQTNDLLLVCLTQDGGASAITTAASGWAMIGTGAASGSSRQQWAYKVAASGAEANPLFSGTTDDWIGTCLVIRDADPTTPFGSLVSGTDFIRTDWNNVSSSASGALTSAVNECLLIYSWGADSSGTQYMRAKLSELTCLDKYTTTVVNHIIGYKQQQTAGAAPTATMYSQVANEGGNGWVLAVRNKTGGALSPDVRATMNELKWHGTWETQQDGITWQSLSNFAASVNGITCSSTAPTIAYSTVSLTTTWGNSTAMNSTESTAGSWVGGTFTIASTDMTGMIIGLQYAFQQGQTNALVGSDGFLLGLSDGTNWVTYQLVSKAKGWSPSAEETAFVALGNATAYASSGSINLAAVTRVAYLNHRIGSSTGNANVYLRNLTLFTNLAITGGGASRPLTFRDYYNMALSWGTYGWVRRQSSSQIQVECSTQIGDGTNVTYFDGSAQSLEFPAAWSNTTVNNWQMYWNAATNSVTVKVKASASDTIKLAAGVLASDTLQNVTIDSASAAGATYDFGQSFVGFVPTWDTDIACVNATFSGCDPVATKGANFTNVIVKNTLASSSGEAAVVVDTSGSTLDSCSISCVQDLSLGGNASYHLELGTAVTSITLTDVTFTGTPGTDKVHVLKTTGTVTININGTTSLAAGDVTSAGATVSIVATPVFQTVTVSNATAGSRIQIYDTTSSTELYNGTPVFPYTWTDGSAAAADRAIRLRVAYVSGVTAKTFIEASIGTCGQTAGTAAVSYLVNQTNDTTYNSNAIDGPAVYATSGITFVDSGLNDRVECSIAGGSVAYPTIYACFAYWNFTATGIANDFTYIDAPDTANYLLSGMKIRNTSATDLVVTGGYGRDATSGLSADIIDTAGSTGNIFLAPDHVVPFATGSGVTAQDKIDIASQVLTSAASAPISAEIIKVAGETVTGSGTELDPWGPV